MEKNRPIRSPAGEWDGGPLLKGGMNMQGKILKLWLSPDTAKKSRYGWRTLGGILGIAALAVLLTCGGAVWLTASGTPVELLSLGLCLGVSALTVFLALRLGRRSVQDATVFFWMEGDRLFAVNARSLVYHGRDILSHAAATMEVQQFLQKLAENPYLPAGADEIRRVERIRENRSHYALVCQVRRPGQRTVRRTYFLVKGLEDQELLLHQLERRKSWENDLDAAENRKPFFILLSALACGGFVLLCVLSHPAVARLPQDIYFPCLGLAFAALCVLVYFAIRQSRGE